MVNGSILPRIMKSRGFVRLCPVVAYDELLRDYRLQYLDSLDNILISFAARFLAISLFV
jgi:hypothetical protein